MEEIRTARLVLRDLDASDHAAVHRFAADPEVVRFMDWGPNTPDETTAFLDLVTAAATAVPRTRWALAVVRAADDLVIGTCELHVEDPVHRRGSMGYTLARDAWGHGYATEAAAAVLALGLDRLRLHKVSATCDPANAGSARVLEKIGMTFTAVLEDHFRVRGEWRDRQLYEALAYRIGRADVADVPRLLEIRRSAFAARAPAAYGPAEVETLLDDVDPGELAAMASAGTLVVARRGTSILGLAGWAGDRLRHVYVDPAHHRQGIATALVRHVEAATGAAVVRAGVALHAEPFYRALGYRVVRRAVAWDGSGYFEMIREL